MRGNPGVTRVLVWLSLSVLLGLGVSYGVALLTRGGKPVEVFGDGSLYIASVAFTTGVLSRLVSRQIAQARRDATQASSQSGGSGQGSPQVNSSTSTTRIPPSEPILLLAALLLTVIAAVLFGVSQGQVLTKPDVTRTLILEGNNGPGNLPNRHDQRSIGQLNEQERRGRLTTAMENLKTGLSANQRDEREAALKLFLKDLQEEASREREGVRKAHMLTGFLILSSCVIIAGIAEYRIPA
jgi:hypothetical protein